MQISEQEQRVEAHPLDIVERMAALNEWSFERADDDELSISVSGGWADYHIAFSWLEDLEALHLGCAFDVKVAERRRPELLNLIALINEQLWVGHFGLWERDGVMIYRHAILLTGGVLPSPEQCEAVLKAGIEACERYYQAVQFVIWAGRSARDALDAALFETVGEA
jgi:hypothetical protein